MIINTRNKAYRLELGGGTDKPARRNLHLVHANDQQIDDDFEGRRNWTFMLVVFASVAACLSSSAAVLSFL